MKNIKHEISEVLNEILLVIERMIKLNLQKYPDSIFSQYKIPEAYLDIVEKNFTELFHQVEKLKTYLKIKKEFYRSIRDLITTIQTLIKEMEITQNEVRILILPAYKRMLDAGLENFKINREIKEKIQILDVISEHFKKSLKRIELSLIATGYDRKRNTDDLEEALTLIIQGDVTGAKERIEHVKERLKQLEKKDIR